VQPLQRGFMAPSETAAALRAASNLAHWIEGAVLLALVVVGVVEARGGLRSRAGQCLWPGIVALAGLFLPVFMLLRRGLSRIDTSWSEIVGDPQQIEHLWLAAILLVAGSVEIARRAGMLRARSWGFAIPLGLVLLGFLLWIHIQYGTPQAVERATLLHRLQGSFLILAGIAMGCEIFWPSKRRPLTFAWLLFLAASSVLLLTYHEPPGAYEARDTSRFSLAQPLLHVDWAVIDDEVLAVARALDSSVPLPGHRKGHRADVPRSIPPETRRLMHFLHL